MVESFLDFAWENKQIKRVLRYLERVKGFLTVRVRYCECDPMGVVHHTIYPVWFEMGRTELLRTTGKTYRQLEEAGVFLAIVRLQVSYKKPAKYDDVVRLETTMTDVGHVKIEHTYELFRDDELLCSASTTLACIDRLGKARQIPEGLFDVSTHTGMADFKPLTPP